MLMCNKKKRNQADFTVTNLLEKLINRYIDLWGFRMKNPNKSKKQFHTSISKTYTSS